MQIFETKNRLMAAVAVGALLLGGSGILIGRSMTAPEAAAPAASAEEEEEAAILADLSGSIPGVDKDEAAEFTAWLNLIDGDIINKMMQDDHPRHKTPPSEVNLDDWMANLEKTMPNSLFEALQLLDTNPTH